MEKPQQSKARILLYDIETTPIISYNWGIYDQDRALKVLQDWWILSFAYKWLGEDKIHVVAQPDFESYKHNRRNDAKVISELYKLFTQADVLIAHNGDRFDQRKSNTRILLNKMQPPEPYKQIDTLKVAKKYFAFTSNHLTDLGEYLNVGKKIPTSKELWFDCMAGDAKAWREMKAYNKHDVSILEGVYLKMRPWIENHPALNLLLNKIDACPKCGLGPLHSKGKQVSKTGVYQRWQCQNCGGYSRARMANKTLQKVMYVN